MTSNDRIEQRIAGWLTEEAAGELPDRVLEATFVETRASGQVRVWPWRRNIVVTPRFASMSGLIAAALVVVVGGGAIYLATSHGAAGPAACPSPSFAAAKPTADQKGRLPTAVGHVADGASYITSVFRPALTFTAAIHVDGIEEENPTGIRIERAGTFWQVYAPTSFNVPASGVPSASSGLRPQASLSADVVSWLLANPDLDVQQVAPITIGGIVGQVVDGQIAPTAAVDPAGYYELVTVPCQAGPGFGFFGRDHFRIIVLNVRGTTVLIGESAESGQWFYTGPGAGNIETLHATFAFPTD
jgi:hypothetical protein